ncbi:MAG: NADH:flavin oxidoreductase/NADH oxidase [Candidatus Korobacteraceae bacterium]|jgi:2,4-dienoyl-CoA reductase-like NADH-dependent reductase (Old Yellow Enzyme family)
MNLFDPLKIRDITFRNRIAVSPMCEYSSEDGFASDWHLVHLGCRAVGGAAAVLTEAIAVVPEGRISPSDLGIWKDAHIDNLARIVRFIRQQGAVAGTQLAHAGFKASTSAPWIGAGKPVSVAEGGWRPIFSSTSKPFTPESIPPEALTVEAIARLAHCFAEAARRSLEAGYELIEIHAAHGYLVHQFLSPLVNTRTDQYGASFENRTRFLREIVAAVRHVWPERLPLWLRITASDWTEGGWTIEDSVALARQVKPLGVDLVDASSGGIVPGARIPVGPGYQTAFAERIRRDTGILTGAVGMITSPEQAQHIIATGQADVVLLARQLLREPYWPLRAAHVLKQDAPWPKQYERARW